VAATPAMRPTETRAKFLKNTRIFQFYLNSNKNAE